MDLEWNRPGRLENYIMALMCQVARIMAKDPGRIQPKDFKLNFEIRRRPLTEAERLKKQQEIGEAARQRWAGFIALASKGDKK